MWGGITRGRRRTVTRSHVRFRQNCSPLILHRHGHDLLKWDQFPQHFQQVWCHWVSACVSVQSHSHSPEIRQQDNINSQRRFRNLHNVIVVFRRQDNRVILLSFIFQWNLIPILSVGCEATHSSNRQLDTWCTGCKTPARVNVEGKGTVAVYCWPSQCLLWSFPFTSQ